MRRDLKYRLARVEVAVSTRIQCYARADNSWFIHGDTTSSAAWATNPVKDGEDEVHFSLREVG